MYIFLEDENVIVFQAEALETLTMVLVSAATGSFQAITPSTDSVPCCLCAQWCCSQQCAQEACKHIVILATLIPQLFMRPWENIFLLRQSLFDVAER